MLLALQHPPLRLTEKILFQETTSSVDNAQTTEKLPFQAPTIKVLFQVHHLVKSKRSAIPLMLARQPG